jgi:UDP-3-O-[3-hydroxymyristoyl] N-acetylglucosamine deacetylase
MALYQQTLKKATRIEGIGLHTGKRVKMDLFPAPPSSGIHFISNHLNQKARFKAAVDHITETNLSTSLGIGDTAQVQTVEHLLSALFGLGIDNLTIQLDDLEVPILDGSALPFVNLLLEAGTVRQNRKKPILKILRKIAVEENGKSIAVLPLDRLQNRKPIFSVTKISYFIDFKNPLIAKQSYTIDLSRESFIQEIAPARTFGFLNEVEALQKKGLIQGGSLDNAVVIGHRGILNKEGLRFSDEFVRHKILDLIGDFSLLGYAIQGHIVARCAGHSLHAKLMEKILEEKDASELVQDSPLPLSSPSSVSSGMTASSIA